MWQTLTTTFSELGESPFWHTHERSLYWLDIPGRALLRTRGDIGSAPAVERWAMPSEPGCMAPARRGGLVVALRDGIYRAQEWGGELRPLVRFGHDVRTTRANDGKCDPLGRFWVGTLYEPKGQRVAALYCLDARGGGVPIMTRMAGEVVTANGLAFAPDRRTLYWADTAAHAVHAWDWEAEANRLERRREFQRFDYKPVGWTPTCGVAYEGRPDGAAIDAQGRYWVAMYEGAQLLCFAPTGERLVSLPVPAQCPTMPCFGGDDLRTLFVTTAREGRPAVELERLPASGAVLSTRVETPGLPVAFFED
ncbi:MAG: SMP-30/Gluconolaconase/LRE-like region-containing protein [Variovorax sp.]|nr:SMP-30/Gluconolaconase/LRE-like region-containing protein [Variovorax sp.]